jgi:phage protein D
MASGDKFKAVRPSIFVDGTEDAGLAQGLLRMSVQEDVQGLYRAELRFGNWGPKNSQIGFLHFDRKKLDFGKRIRLELEGQVLFDGRISAIEAVFGEGASPEISVLLEDLLQDLRMTRRTRTFENKTDKQVIEAIATDHGLTATVSLTGQAHKILAQVNQSDLAFLRDRARAAGAELWIEGTQLYVKPRSSRTGQPLKLKYGGDLRQFTALADLAHQRTSVTVSGWDVSNKTAIKQKADDATVRNELGNDSSGSKILNSAFKKKRNESIAHMVPLTSAEATAQAEAWFRAVARRFVVGHGLAHPNAKLRVGTWVELDGVGNLFNGKYYLAAVRHVFDGTGGFRSEFTAERPGLGA